MTKQVFEKYVRVIIVGLLVIWILLTPSHFQKGGVDYRMYPGIAFFVTIISFLIVSEFNPATQAKAISISILFTLISLILTTYVLGPRIVSYFYGDATWVLWKVKHRIFINGIYYGLNAIILTLSSALYFRGAQNVDWAPEKPE